jgi:glycolate oxidase FAD binding subunit
MAVTVDRLSAFADEVGDSGPVTCVGGKTQWDVGGGPDAAAREVRAPAGVVAFEPAEMIVRVGAGTTVAALDAELASSGQMVPLDPVHPEGATVGGVLAVGRSGVRRLRYGPVRDTLLEARLVAADGAVVKAGGPVVKNVSGFDLCRVLVGSLGTLGFLGEVVLRTQPRPAVTRWFSGVADPFEVRRRLFRPSSILWDGSTTWILLEGHAADVEAEAALLGASFASAEKPDLTRWPDQRSLRPGTLPTLTGSFLAEVGVGTVHVDSDSAVAETPVDRSTIPLHERLKRAFDPAGRMNPGRTVLGGPASR